MSMRMEKVNSQIQRVITEIIQEEIDDPSLTILSITRVETTSDLREARVYFSLLNEKKMKHAKETLDKMSKFIKVNLGQRMRIKVLPQLTFIPDESMRYSVYIAEKIEEARSHDSDRIVQDNGENK